MKEEVEADVHIRFEGESNAVKEFSAILVTALDTVTVRCLPANLPHDLPVDLSKLAEIGSTITVADIVVPEGVEIINNKEDVIAIAQEQRAEEVEVAPVAAEGAEGAPAAEGAEGAPAAEGTAAPEAKKE
jgi:large subunit ribosomal protein L25